MFHVENKLSANYRVMELLVDYSECWIPSTFYFSQEANVKIMLSPIQHLHEQHRRIVKNPKVAVTTCHLSMLLIALTPTVFVEKKWEGSSETGIKLKRFNSDTVYTLLTVVFHGVAITLQQVWIWLQFPCQELLYCRGFSAALCVSCLFCFVSFWCH